MRGVLCHKDRGKGIKETLDAMGKVPRRKLASFLLVGPTGSGKTPFGDYLEKKGIEGKRCVHFDFGHQLRTVAGSGVTPDGFDGKEHSFVRRVLAEGLLLENEHFPIAEKILDSFARKKGFAQEDIMVLNGLPRHRGQARDMEGIVDVRALIVLQCTPEEVYGRIRGNTGGDRTERDDDGIGLVRKKLEIYSKRTEPLIDHYAKAGSGVFRVEVDVYSKPEDVYRKFLSAFSASTF